MIDASRAERLNNFDLLRLFAAAQVMLLHLADNLEVSLSEPLLVVRKLLAFFPGVPIFFVISGFLITASLERTASLRDYFRNRALRIYPALLACTALTFVLILTLGSGAHMTPQPSPSALAVGLAKWLVAQVTIAQFYAPHILKEYFGVGHPNGSLWTIPVELQFYVVLPALWWFLLKGKSAAIGVRRLIFLTALFYGTSVLFLVTRQELAAYSETLALLARVTVVPYLYMFLLGVLLYKAFPIVKNLLVGKGVVWLGAYLVVSLVLESVFGLSPGTATPSLISSTLLALAIVSLAFTRKEMAERLLGGNDISYGVYIFHMVVANAMFQMGWHRSYSAYLAAIVVTIAVAICSWRFVERPALRRKGGKGTVGAPEMAASHR